MGDIAPLDAVFSDWMSASRVKDLGTALTAAIRLNAGNSAQVTVETVFTSAGNPLEFIIPRGVVQEQRLSLDGVEFLELSDAEGCWVLAAFPTRHNGVYNIVSGLPTTHARWKRAERWIGRSRNVSRCYLDHQDFASIGDRISEFGDVEVVKVSGRVVKDGSSVNRGFPVRSGALRPSHLEVIAEVEALGGTVRTITLRAQKAMHVHLRRVAGATFYSGDFALFQELVLSRLEDATAARRALLTGRERRVSDRSVQSVSIRLPEAIMDGPEATAEVLELVGRMGDVSLAVFHRNPYLHFAVTDEFDGSNYDVMITRADAIDIYPGYRASAPSLARIAQRIGERFGAISISNPLPTTPVSLEDLVRG